MLICLKQYEMQFFAEFFFNEDVIFYYNDKNIMVLKFCDPNFFLEKL